MSVTETPDLLERSSTRRAARAAGLPSYIVHDSFAERDALRNYDPADLLENPNDFVRLEILSALRRGIPLGDA